MIRMIPILIFALLALVLFSALMRQQPGNPQKQTGLRIDQPMKSLPLMNAENSDAPLEPKDFQGRVTLINFLASWCAPCEAEMGELVALKKEMTGMEFIGVAWNDAPARIEPWLAEHGNPFDTTLYDPKGRAAISLGVRGIPETYVVDGEGVVRYQLSGPLTKNVREKELQPLIDLLQHEISSAR